MNSGLIWGPLPLSCDGVTTATLTTVSPTRCNITVNIAETSFKSVKMMSPIAIPSFGNTILSVAAGIAPVITMYQ